MKQFRLDVYKDLTKPNNYGWEVTYYEPDCDICRECGEHAEFTREYGSNCCNAAPVDVDPPDWD